MEAGTSYTFLISLSLYVFYFVSFFLAAATSASVVSPMLFSMSGSTTAVSATGIPSEQGNTAIR